MEALQSVLMSFTNWFHGLGQKPIQIPQSFRGIVAHRGVHGQSLAQENSLEAFRLAAQNNIWGTEFDLRWTRDNIAVIYHDPHLGRLHQLPKIIIRNTYFEDLRKLAPDIPTLQEVVTELGGKIHFMIELKEFMENEDQHKHLKKCLSSLSAIEDFHFMSLEPAKMDSLRDFPKEAFIDIAWYDMEAMFQETLKRQHGGLTGHFVLLRDKHRKALNERNISYGTGFIHNKGALYKEIERGCAWVFTEQPIQLKAFLN